MSNYVPFVLIPFIGWGVRRFLISRNDYSILKRITLSIGISANFLTGEGWINPHKVNHPDLGEIWIGGSRKKHMSRTPPSRYIETEAVKNAQFVMYCVSQFPKIEIEKTTVTPAAKDLFWIDVVVKNDRVYPTISNRSLQLKRIEKDKITLASSDKISIVEIPKELTKIDPFNNTTQCELILKEGTEFSLKGKQSLRSRALVKMDGSKGWIEFKVVSKHGGTVKKRININITN